MTQEGLLAIYEQARINPDTPECIFAETLIFNEGWMLRAAMKAWLEGQGQSAFPFLPFPPGVTAYSEAQLYTPFRQPRAGRSAGRGASIVPGWRPASRGTRDLRQLRPGGVGMGAKPIRQGYGRLPTTSNVSMIRLRASISASLTICVMTQTRNAPSSGMATVLMMLLPVGPQSVYRS